MSDLSTSLESSIKDFIHKNFLLNSSAINFSATDSFMEKGIIDSTGILELVNFIQQSFQIEVKDDELIPENLDSITNICRYIEKKRIRGA
ncbi:MAG TPA: acyl carrier protein [Chitinispirillaceae bacterium]|nr:acyl carrier protein [Chitinispirillaceae bacterium]